MPGLMKKLLSCGSKSFASDVDVELPEGHIWVCVGTNDEQKQRLQVEANYLNHPLFEDLLRISVHEFGYSYDGALRIACHVDLFLHLIHLLQSRSPSAHYMDLSDLIHRFHARGRTES